MRAIVIGAGSVARELLSRLGPRWEITVIDVSRQRLDAAAEIRPFTPLRGDGSSRLTLERAGIAEAQALIACTGDDEVNLEACRIALDKGIHRLVAVAADADRRASFGELGITTVSPAELAARRIEVSLETRRISSSAFADGRAEAIEFRIAHDSPVRGRKLRDLHAASWTAGAILRRGELVVPHGETVLEAGDLITVVGAGTDFAEIVRTFTSGEQRFPLDYGKRVAVALERDEDFDTALAEASYLVGHSQASSLVLVHRDPAGVPDRERAEAIQTRVEAQLQLADGTNRRARAVRGRPSLELTRLPGEESVGVLVVPATGRHAWWRGAIRPLALVRRSRRPVLLARGTHPYRTIVVPARRTPAGRVAVRAAIDIARNCQAELVAVAALDATFIAGAEAHEEGRRAVNWVEEEAAVQAVEVRGVVLRGNPVRTLVAEGESAGLMVLGVPMGVQAWTSVARLVALRTRCSLLLVPVSEHD